MITVLTVQNSLTALESVWSLAPLKSRKPLSYAYVFCVFEVLNMCVCVCDSIMYLMAFIVCMASVVFACAKNLYNHRKLV